MRRTIDRLMRRKIPGFFFSALFKKDFAEAERSKSLSHIAFIRPGKIGDLLVATPLFHALKAALPNIKITVFCSSYNLIVIKHSPDVDNVKETNFHSLIHLVKIVRWMHRNGVEMVIDLTPGFSRTSTLLSSFLRMGNIRTAGMHKGEFSRYFDITTDTHGKHIIERNRVLLETVLQYSFGKNDDFRPLIYSTFEQKLSAAEFINEIGGESKFRLGINLSAGQQERQWSYNNYLNLVKMLSEFYDKNIEIILFSYGEQREWSEKIAVQTRCRIAPSTDILTTAEILKFCRFLFTPDTAFLHMASAMKVPVVALYCIAGENLIRWRAYNVPAKELIAGDSRNVNEISPENAFKNIQEMVEFLKGNKE